MVEVRYIHVHVHVHVHEAWDKGWKTTFEASSTEMNECLHVFLSMLLLHLFFH